MACDLSRATCSYRNGYQHGYSGSEYLAPNPDVMATGRAFANSDYDAGYKAGANDALWSHYHAKRVHASRLTA